MKFVIKTKNFSLTDALRNHAERRLRFALTFCDDRIDQIVVRLSDINGPRGGVDKCCRLQVVLDGLPPVVVEDTEADMYVAIDRAANRAGRTVRRRLTRRREMACNRQTTLIGDIMR
ncbi:HPF/RaiA family ribosome-associated protein [Pseudomonadota bacterium]|jgi:ribosomal subunit interface protein